MKPALKLFILLTSLFILAGVLFYYKYPFWNHYKTDNFTSLMAFEGRQIKGLHGRQILVHQDFEKHMWKIDEYAGQCNVEVLIVHAYRSSVNKLTNTIVEPAKYSNHEAGHAIDFNLKYKGDYYISTQLSKRKLKNQPQPIQDFILAVRGNPDLRWGGDFGTEDPVHIDFPLNIVNKTRWKACEKECAADFSMRIPKWQFWK